MIYTGHIIQGCTIVCLYLEEEYGDTKVDKYLCGLLHSLEVHNVKDDNEKHHYHHGSTGNRARR